MLGAINASHCLIEAVAVLSYNLSSEGGLASTKASRDLTENLR